MKARPILFSAPMIRALLEGRKTQTRRTLRHQDVLRPTDDGPEFWTGFLGWQPAEAILNDPSLSTNKQTLCPYGKSGDLLWVRETHYVWSAGYQDGTGRQIAYRATEPDAPCTWTPSIHMPRWASRLTLKITDVRVQRLQEISEADAIAEGIEPEGADWKSYETILEGRYKGEPHPHAVVPNRSPVTSYRELWESINGAGSWAANPWVWALSFTVEKRNVDDVLRRAA